MSKLAESSKREATGMETNRRNVFASERYNIGGKDSGCFSENRKPDNAVLDAATERSSLADFKILPPKQADVFGSPEKRLHYFP